MTKLNTWFLLSLLDNSGYIYSKHWMTQLEGRLWWISLASTGTGLTSSKGNVAGVNWLLTCFLLAWKVNIFLRLEEKGRRLHQQFLFQFQKVFQMDFPLVSVYSFRGGSLKLCIGRRLLSHLNLDYKEETKKGIVCILPGMSWIPECNVLMERLCVMLVGLCF